MRLLLTFALLSAALRAEAPKVEDLASAGAPAFVLLGLSPANIERPRSARKLAIALATKTVNETRDYAIEFNPYWLLSQQNVTLGDLSSTPGVLCSLLNSFSISMASKDNSTTPGLSGSTLGLGFRARVVEAGPNSRMAEAVEQFRQTYQAVYFPDNEDPTKLADEEGPSAFQQAQVRAKALAIQDLAGRRQGFSLDLAGGVTTELPTNDFDQSFTHQEGLWLVPAYTFEQTMDALGVIRGLRDEQNSNRNAVDWGLRLGVSTPDFSLSSEYVRRQLFDPTAPTAIYRLVGIVEYRVLSDLTLTATFGRDFDAPTAPGQNLVSKLGLKFGLRPDLEGLDAGVPQQH